MNVPTDDDEEQELELAKEQPVRLDEYALQPDVARESAVESHRESRQADTDPSAADDYGIAGERGPTIDIGAMPTITPSITPTSASTRGTSTPPKGYASTKNPSRSPIASKHLKKLTKNPTLMLAAAIVIGGLAAIVVGKLVLWLLAPAPQKPRYGAAPTHEGPRLVAVSGALAHSIRAGAGSAA